LSGFPPKEIQNPLTDPIHSIFSNGDVITVDITDSNKTSTVPQPTTQQVIPPIVTTTPTVPQTSPIQSHITSSAPGLITTNDGCVVRRVIPDDNSCLFHAISYVLENKAKDKVSYLRNLIAKEIMSDPNSYNEGILGKKPADYQKWIKDNNSWGGSVELIIFAKHYKTEIMAYDITQKRGNCFAEDKGYTSRVYLIYDGIHYDCLVWNILPSAQSSDFDVTIFNSKDQSVEKEFEKFMEKEHKSGKFVDEYNYVLKCGQCGILVKGNSEATQHANTTGHTRFTQDSN